MLNRAIIMGRMTRDPELRYTTAGKPVCSYCVAVERDFAVQGQKDTDYFDVVTWEKSAEFVSKFFKKGDGIYVDGRFQTRMYKDKDGNNRKAYELVSQFVGFPPGKAGGAAAEDPPKDEPPQRRASDFGDVEDDNHVPF